MLSVSLRTANGAGSFAVIELEKWPRFLKRGWSAADLAFHRPANAL